MVEEKKEEWEKVGANSFWNFKDKGNETLIGVFVSVEPNQGSHNSNLYTVNVNGTLISFWGSTVLDTRLKNIVKGEEIKVTLLGKVTSKKGVEYTDYEVFHRKSAFSKVEDIPEMPKDKDEIDTDSIPF